MDTYLYIDCDGVIYDTIKVGFKDMEQSGIDLTNVGEIDKFFKQCDWNDLINRAGEINDSIYKILKLKESNRFKDVSIATHHCSYQEAVTKLIKFYEDFNSKTNNSVKVQGSYNVNIPNKNKYDLKINVYNIPRKIKKNHVLLANNNILVDDAKEKIIDWVNDGGIGVLFNTNVDELIYPDNNTPYYVTNDLLDLFEVLDNINSKKKVR